MKNETFIASSTEKEKLVLGAMVNNQERTSIGLKLVHEEDFFESRHKIIFKTIQHIFQERKVVDIHLIGSKLNTDGNSEFTGGFPYLIELAQGAGTSVYIEAYCEDLKELTAKRKLINHVNSITNELSQNTDSFKIIEKYKNFISDIGKNISQHDFNIQPYTLENLQRDLSQTKEGLKTGFRELDEMIRIPNEAITLIGGRPSHGKTTFMLNLFLNLINQYPQHNFYFFSYEETRQQVALKIINILSGWIFNEAQNLIQLEGYLRIGSKEYGMVENGKKKYQELVESGRLKIVGETYYINQLASIISSLKHKEPLGAVFIDYIQKIKNKNKFGTRQLELADTSNTILETAKACSIPIILGAQLGRDKESKDKVKLDNLRESGDLEQDANVILGLFNPSMEKAQEETNQLTDRKVELKVTPLKNRNGSVNKTITLDFDRPLLKIKDKLERK